MKKIYKIISKCRICKSKNLILILNLNNQPPANSLVKSEKIKEFKIPLKLMFCRNCHLAQLNATVEPKYLFQNYVWVTATSNTAKNYSNYFCSEILKRSNKKKPFVVEIASNDGTFLKPFLKRGCKILGVDPAKNIAKIANKKQIKTIPKFFNQKISKNIKKKYKQPQIIFARNVVPHVKEIHNLVKGMSDLINDNGIVAIEFHYAKEIIDKLHYDSIYHEHLFYFSIKTISYLFKKYNLNPFDLFLSPISGGSLVIFFSKKNIKKSSRLKKFIANEKNKKINNVITWRKFGKKSKKHANKFKNLIKSFGKEKLIGYGASARSSTLLNFSKIDFRNISYIIDKNPFKQGLLTPGTKIPIVSFKKINKQNNMVLLAWNFENEIVSFLRNKKFKGNIIVPLPNIHIK